MGHRRPEMAQTQGSPDPNCPQTAEFLGLQPERPHGPRPHRQALDFNAFCTACFLIALLGAAGTAGWRMEGCRFFTKLSTESVHRVGPIGLSPPGVFRPFTTGW